MPDVPLPPKKDNRIDKNEAKFIGDFLETIGDELKSSNARLKHRALTDIDVPMDVVTINKVTAEYKLSLDISKDDKDSSRNRKSEVVISAEYDVTKNPAYNKAPYNILYGIISPAERDRERIISLMKDNNIPVLNTNPIFNIRENVYWVPVLSGDPRYYIVSLANQTCIMVKTLEELNNHIAGMLVFLHKQLQSILEK